MVVKSTKFLRQCIIWVFVIPGEYGQTTLQTTWRLPAGDVYCVLCTVYCVLCTVYCVLCTVYCVLCTVYCVLCTVYCVLCTVYCVLCTVYCVLCTVYCVLCTVYCVLCTVYCVLCTVYCVLCTVYCVLCTVYCVLCTVYCAEIDQKRERVHFIKLTPPLAGRIPKVQMPLFKSSGFTPFLAGQWGKRYDVSSILALGAAFVTTHQGIFFIAVFDFILICRETAQKWENLGVWGPKSKSKVQKTAKKRYFCPISPNYAQLQPNCTQLQPTDTRKKRYTLPNASANIEYRLEFSHLVGLLGDRRYNKMYTEKLYYVATTLFQHF